MFIIRAVFWLSVVLLLIPGGGKDGASFSTGAVDALLAARGVVADLSGICERQPDVCSHGGAALQSFGARAWQNAAMLVDRFGNHHGDGAPAAGTLKAEDIAPAFAAPARPDGRA